MQAREKFLIVSYSTEAKLSFSKNGNLMPSIYMARLKGSSLPDDEEECSRNPFKRRVVERPKDEEQEHKVATMAVFAKGWVGVEARRS